MWSIYDTLLLVSGLITAAIALLPIPEVKAKTRATAALAGGGLIVLALILGNVRSFTYPSIVFVGPFIALASLGVVVAEALHRRKNGSTLQFDERAQSLTETPGEAVGSVNPPVVSDEGPVGNEWLAVHRAPELSHTVQVEPVVRQAPQTVAAVARVYPPTVAGPPSSEDVRLVAWAEANDPATPAARLATIVGRFPEFGPAVATHPNCYPELRAWIQEFVLSLVPTGVPPSSRAGGPSLTRG